MNWKPKKLSAEQKVRASLDLNPGHYEAALKQGPGGEIVLTDKLKRRYPRSLSGSVRSAALKVALL